MNKAKLIERIKEQLKAVISNEVKFAEVKAGDLLISSPDEELIIGSEVYTIDQDGNNIPLTDGDYTLDSGVKIKVVGGKVEAIVAAEAEVEAEEEEVADAEVEVETEEVADEDEPEEAPTADADMKSIMKKMMARLEKCEKMIEEMGKEKKVMEQKLSAISSQPSTTAISVEPAEFKSVEDKKSGVGAVDIMSIRDKARKNR
jgi:hypothetical protein